MKLTNNLYQEYNNDDMTVRVEILYNNTCDYFYFNLFINDALEKGDSRIVNGYEDDHVKFFSLKAFVDSATFDAVTTFEVEFKDEL